MAEAAAVANTELINGGFESDSVSSCDTVNTTGNIYRSTTAVYQTGVYQDAVYQGEEGEPIFWSFARFK